MFLSTSNDCPKKICKKCCSVQPVRFRFVSGSAGSASSWKNNKFQFGSCHGTEWILRFRAVRVRKGPPCSSFSQVDDTTWFDTTNAYFCHSWSNSERVYKGPLLDYISQNMLFKWSTGLLCREQLDLGFCAFKGPTCRREPSPGEISRFCFFVFLVFWRILRFAKSSFVISLRQYKSLNTNFAKPKHL